MTTEFDFGARARWITACARLSCASGRPDELDGAGGGIGDHERLGIGEPDVLGREDHEPARDEPGVLARFEHAGEPVEAGVDVGAADALDERREHVVVLVVAVAQRAQREGGLGVLERDRSARPASTASAVATSSDVSAWRASPSAAVDEVVRARRRAIVTCSSAEPAADPSSARSSKRPDRVAARAARGGRASSARATGR